MIREQVTNADRVPLITSSDAHSLNEIGQKSSILLLEEPTLEEIRMAFSGVNGRRIIEGGLPPC